MTDFFIFSKLTWLFLFLSAGVFLGVIFLLFGGEFDFKKLPRHVFRPTRANLRGIHINSPSGIEQVDWKKGYNSKYEMLYLKGRKSPLVNVVVPNLAKCMAADPDATIWPESMEGLLFGDPRGRILRYTPASQEFIRVPTADGRVEVISRNAVLSRKGEMSENLDELQVIQDIESARQSGQEKMQAEIHNFEQLANAMGSIVTPLLQQKQKGGGGT